MNNKLILVGIAAFVVILGAVALTPAMATHRSDHKVPICHFDPDTGTYTNISVGSAAAVNAHLTNHQYPGLGGDYPGPCV